MLGLGSDVPNGLAASPMPQFMHYVPAPPQFMSPGAVSADSLMLMSPDYSAVYHPLIVPAQVTIFSISISADKFCILCWISDNFEFKHY
jgi:hypothetical protein